MKFVQKELAKLKWYRQGAAVKILYISPPYSSCVAMTVDQKTVDLQLCFLTYFSNDYATLFFSKKDAKRVTNYFLHREQNIPGDMWSRYQKWRKSYKQFQDSVVKGLPWAGIQQLSNAELLKCYYVEIEKYHSLWRESMFHDAFDVFGETLIYNVCDKAGVRLTSAEVDLLVQSPYLLPTQIERLDIARLAAAAERNPALQGLIKKGASIGVITKRFPFFVQKIKAHTDTYFWSLSDYAFVRRLTSSHFLNTIRELLKNPKKLNNELRLPAVLKRDLLKKKVFIRRMKIPHAVLLVANMISIVATWRDERKAMNQMGNELLKRYLQEFTRRSRVPLREAEYALYWEAEKLLSPTSQYRKILQTRRRGIFVAIPKKTTLQFVSGREAKALLQFMNSLVVTDNVVGRTAYPGKVIGTAKIVLSQKDFKKFQRGDILVAPNTRPEYIPVMKIAGGIVTEEGGITSHAAIVSRELKIPAVVGAQGVLEQIKEGDIIEVDANRGIIKKV
ncbi:MAG: PEP-utilizing enzyme [Patescibacteria group bacterium]|jgi:phosphohistidine swiveling domain-containing protein